MLDADKRRNAAGRSGKESKIQERLRNEAAYLVKKNGMRTRGPHPYHIVFKLR